MFTIVDLFNIYHMDENNMLNTQNIKAQLEERLKFLGTRVDEIADDLREPSDPDFAEHAT